MESLKFLLKAWLKGCKSGKNVSGFTLIEVLVAMILAVIVIVPLLAFVINITDNDRKEQAKITSEQELQAATEYITRDLQQAVYIYDRDGLAAITNNYNNTTCTSASTGCSQLPAGSDKIPVLVFWKRNFIQKSTPYSSSLTCDSSNLGNCNDSFAYSLVAYYLIKDSSTTWSSTARIGRFEIKDGVKKTDGTYVNETDATVGRDAGFQLFSLNPQATISSQMNAWTKKTGEAYTNNIQVLVDYVDQSNLQTNPDTDAALKLPREVCPGDVTSPTPTDPDWKQTPDYSNSGVSNTFKTYSFYACPYSSNNLVKVFIRGNAQARLNPTATTYKSGTSSYFPRAKIEVKSIGTLGG